MRRMFAATLLGVGGVLRTSSQGSAAQHGGSRSTKM